MLVLSLLMSLSLSLREWADDQADLSDECTRRFVAYIELRKRRARQVKRKKMIDNRRLGQSEFYPCVCVYVCMCECVCDLLYSSMRQVQR